MIYIYKEYKKIRMERVNKTKEGETNRGKVGTLLLLFLSFQVLFNGIEPDTRVFKNDNEESDN